jgi:hypothetical protein
MKTIHKVHVLEARPWSFGQDLGCVHRCGCAPLTKPGPLFFPPSDVLNAILQLQVEQAAGTCGFLAAALERLQEPVLVNPPFALKAED